MSEVDKEDLREETAPLTKDKGATQEAGGDADAARAKKKKIIIIAVIILLVIGVILAIVLPLTLKHKDEPNPPPPNPDDPFSNPEFNNFQMDKTTIVQSVWASSFTLNQQRPNKQEPISPQAQSFMKLQDPLNGQQYRPVNPNKIVDSPGNNWASEAVFNIDLVDNYQARVLIRDSKYDEDTQLKKRMVQPDLFVRPVLAKEARLSQLGFQYTTDSSFHFSFSNIYSGETIVTTENRKFLISDFYSEIGFVLPTQRCYGLGQRNGKFQLQAGTYSLHARTRDEGLVEDDQLGGRSGNHIHPFVLCQTAVEKDFFGIFFVSTAPQVFEVIQFPNQSKMALNYITIGAPLEMYFLIRGQAQEIIQKYHAMIGNPQMPPYYALGVFLGSNSYKTLDEVKNLVSNYSALGIPLEGAILESYNTQSHWTYTVDATSFANLTDYATTIHNNHQRLIYGTSMALHNSKDFTYFNKAIANKCLVDSYIYSTIQGRDQATGILDDTTVQYIDPFHIGAQDFFKEALTEFTTTVNGYDGLIIKDAYMANHVSGEIDPKTKMAETPVIMRRRLGLTEETIGSYEPYLVNTTNNTNPDLYYLPFVPAFNYSGYMDNFTQALNVSHNGSNTIYDIFVHNGVAHRTLQKTFYALTNESDSTTKRPLLFTDASWAGSGAYGVALITDLYRSWDNLKNMVSQVIAMSMYGMSNTMVDVCGSLGPDSYDFNEFCVRWMQVAAFMPMARNYFNETYKDLTYGTRNISGSSDPTKPFGPALLESYKRALLDRMTYSRYIYSQMYANYREGGSLVRPLFFDYPNDDSSFDNIDTTFLLGDSIKVNPVLEQGLNENTTYSVYFPAGLWINLNDTTQVLNLAQGQNVNLFAYFNQSNLYLKGGKIIPYSNLSTGTFMTTYDVETKAKTSFMIARDAAGKYAEGFVLIDDGVSYRSYVDEKYTYWKVRYAEKSINFWVQYGNYAYEPENVLIHYLDQIQIVNAEDLSDTDFACYMGTTLDPVNLQYYYNETTKSLIISPVGQANITFKDIGFIKFGNSKKEPNFCDKDNIFSFTGVKNDTLSNKEDTYWVYNLTNKQKASLNTLNSLRDDPVIINDQLIIEFTLLDDEGTLHVEVTNLEDFNSDKKIKYRVPTPEVYNVSAFGGKTLTKTLTNFVKIASTDPFQYAIYKDTTQATTLLWTSDSKHLYISDYFVMDAGQFQTNQANGGPILGMGERAGSIFYKNEKGGIHSRYTFDQANPVEDGNPPGKNFYGYQPFYSFQASTLDWFGVFDVSSYATDYIVTNDIGDGKTSQIQKITIGGTIDKFFFIGSKIDDVIRKYQKLVGNPVVPPLWAFGWQQCRFGYVTVNDWYDVIGNYSAFDLPLDVMWADIDYMDDYKLFTISQDSYAELPEKVLKIKEMNMHFVPIMDAGVAVRKNQGYTVLENGLTQDIFIKRSDNQAPLTAGVWCGHAYFPDFFKAATYDWWSSSFDSLYDDKTSNGLGLKFDGIWLDENEATNFCNGYCITSERPADSLRNKPFYVPGWRDLEDKALGVDGYHPEIDRHEYDVHNLFPLMQTKATADYLKKKLDESGKLRPYVLTRSNYPGIGKYGHHWLGDNWSTVDYMALSVDGVYSYNLFGMPFIGSDICGFNGDAAPDLCTKWHQLGSLYPFARNHNQNLSASQEPYRFNTTITGYTQTYTDLIRIALRNRYSLIKYYYSAFHQIGEFGGSFMKPLFYEFQNDPIAYDEATLKNNILLGEALKASILTTSLDFTAHATTEFYFPSGLWCPVLPSIDATKCYDSTTGTTNISLSSKLEDYYVHLRGGYIIPYQDATALVANTTKDLEDATTDILVLANTADSTLSLPDGLSKTARAMGFIYLDDGNSTANISRFDLYLQNNGDNTFSFYNQKMTDKEKLGFKHETLGSIKFIWASKGGLETMNKAQLEMNDEAGTKVDLEIPVLANDVLTLSVKKADDGTTYTFWDFKAIHLSKSA